MHSVLCPWGTPGVASTMNRRNGISAHNTIIIVDRRGEMQAEQVRSTCLVGHTSEVAGKCRTEKQVTCILNQELHSSGDFDAWIRRH